MRPECHPSCTTKWCKTPKGETGYPDNAVNLPSLCAVSIQVQSIANSTYGFGLFLPDEWNERFLAVGNGGFAGGINYLDMVRTRIGNT
jgi:feruloyl esterase